MGEIIVIIKLIINYSPKVLYSSVGALTVSWPDHLWSPSFSGSLRAWLMVASFSTSGHTDDCRECWFKMGSDSLCPWRACPPGVSNTTKGTHLPNFCQIRTNSGRWSKYWYMRTVNWPLLNVAFRMTGNPQGLEECMEKAGLTLGDYWENLWWEASTDTLGTLTILCISQSKRIAVVGFWW